MFTLRLLGGLKLEGGAVEPGARGTQRRRLALLAVLALAPSRRMSRDRLIGILWPDGTDADGRARLSSAVYDMRQLLGDAALPGHGDDLWLAPDAIAVDVADFTAAVRREDWQRAAELYQGPLLDGVHLDSTGFEDWLAGHRDRLHREYLRVLERLARWSDLASLEPLSARWTLEVMGHHAAGGDRPGAIRTGERYQARLAEEMGLGPEPSVAARLAELRAVPPASPPPARPTDRPLPVAVTAAPAQGRGRRTAVLGLVAAIIAVAAWLARPATPATPADRSLRVAVFPFRVTGDSAFGFLADGIVDLLSADLEGIGAFASVDPHSLLALVRRSGSTTPRDLARRLGADRYVVGTVYGVGDSMRLHALMHDATDGALVREVRAAGNPGAVPSLVDRLTGQLVAGELGGAPNRIASVAAQTTLSIPALREFLAGETAFRRGRFVAAAAAYRRAVGADTSFALAHYRLSLALLWGNQPGAETAFHDSLALRHADRLSPRDRDLVHAYSAWRAGRGREAWKRYDAIVARHPEDVEAWYQRGETEFHYGPLMGAPIAEARIAFGRVVALDPDHWGARWHLALLDASEGRGGSLRDRARELLALGPDSGSAVEIQLVAGTGPGGSPIVPEQAGELELFGAAWRRAVYLRDVDGARALFTTMLAPARSPYSRQLGRSGLGELALAEGRWEEAQREWASIPSGARFELAAAAAVLPGFERSQAERDALAARLAEWSESQGGLLRQYPGEAMTATYATALLAAARGDSVAAVELAERLDSIATWPGARLEPERGQTVRAYLAHRANRPVAALELLGSGEPTRWYGHAVTSAGAGRSFERFLRAEVLRKLGRPEEALRWYAGFGEHAVYDLAFLAPALLRSAELSQRLERRSVAAEQRGRAAALWRGADSGYRRMLDRQVAESGR